jgi:hypothetical protein
MWSIATFCETRPNANLIRASEMFIGRLGVSRHRAFRGRLASCKIQGRLAWNNIECLHLAFRVAPFKVAHWRVACVAIQGSALSVSCKSGFLVIAISL